VVLVSALVELADEALRRSDDGRGADPLVARDPLHLGDGVVVKRLEDGRRRADVAAAVLEAVDVGDEESVEVEEEAHALLQH